MLAQETAPLCFSLLLDLPNLFLLDENEIDMLVTSHECSVLITLNRVSQGDFDLTKSLKITMSLKKIFKCTVV